MVSTAQIVDSELLRAFVAFADENNFTRAAKRIGLSQPALFERIKRLSRMLESTLYQREGRALALTEAGVKTAAFARAQLRASEHFVSEMRGQSTRETVSLAAGEGAYLYVIAPAVRAFVRAHPGALQALTLGGPSAVTAVLDGTAQLGVGVVDLLPRGLVAKELVKCPMMAAVSRDHLLAKKQKISLRDLCGQRVVLPPEGQSHRAVIARALASVGVSLEQPVEADGWPLLLQFASLNLGVAIVNGVCHAPRDVVLRPMPELGSVSYRLFFSKNAELSALAQQLCDGLVRSTVAR
jgi:DNA-binding transcriptional LysR family regulator